MLFFTYCTIPEEKYHESLIQVFIMHWWADKRPINVSINVQIAEPTCCQGFGAWSSKEVSLVGMAPRLVSWAVCQP